METSLQSTHLSANESSAAHQAEIAQEEEQHIHLPNPSWWPMILGSAILLAIIGLMFIPANPWLVAVAAAFILFGIMGWALEDPMSTPVENPPAQFQYIYNPALSAQEVLDRARVIAERTVTVGSTAYSTHPVSVELDTVKDNGVVLALYGKVELEAQSRRLENELRELPNVLDVRNFIVAEDAILQIAHARLENLRAKGKLEGVKDLDILIENYILHLYGEVPTREMRQALEREVIGIPGVRVVVNHIGLNKDIPGNLGKTRNK